MVVLWYDFCCQHHFCCHWSRNNEVVVVSAFLTATIAAVIAVAVVVCVVIDYVPSIGQEQNHSLNAKTRISVPAKQSFSTTIIKMENNHYLLLIAVVNSHFFHFDFIVSPEP